jgi:hypothetical protein
MAVLSFFSHSVYRAEWKNLFSRFDDEMPGRGGRGRESHGKGPVGLCETATGCPIMCILHQSMFSFGAWTFERVAVCTSRMKMLTITQPLARPSPLWRRKRESHRQVFRV